MMRPLHGLGNLVRMLPATGLVSLPSDAPASLSPFLVNQVDTWPPLRQMGLATDALALSAKRSRPRPRDASRDGRHEGSP
mmetsp:Transcript_20633/g.63007  ORF Transcript_20633/g.63007 Transcript_20633/m.63007 type:complete len:80 (-) Transcript_20633:2915-3154(-)